MTNAEYEKNEAAKLAKQIAEANALKGKEAKEAQADFQETLKAASIVQRNLCWLLDGNYGYGAMAKAKAICGASKRTNKEAQLCQLLAALDSGCGRKGAIAAWKALNETEKAAVSRAVEFAIEYSKA